ncbi:MAG: hydrogenase maturation protease [Deltaproteobacteria bacterium]|nr:hydrogenase maturation protease [Deltaproteobacteria bacterium]
MLILGLGNLLLADEGVGVHAVQQMMAEKRFAGDVVALDIGTAVLDALPALETAERVVIIDAMKADGPPGSVYRIPYDDCLRPSTIGSMHGFDLSRVLAMTGRRDRPEITVIGVEPARIDWSMDLSEAVAAALPVVLQAVEEEITGHRKKCADAPPSRPSLPVNPGHRGERSPTSRQEEPQLSFERRFANSCRM